MRKLAIFSLKSRLVGKVNPLVLGLVIGFTGCNGINGLEGPPNQAPRQMDQVSLEPESWNIYYSNGMPPHPSAHAEGAWSFEFPERTQTIDGHVNYVQTPLQGVAVGQTVTLTFRIEGVASYEVVDPNDHPPATFHIFFEQLGDDLIYQEGRWWAHGGYQLGSKDNQTITLTVPFTSDHWTDVYGQTDPQAFASALGNIGWIGVTFGGQFFWGHGVGINGSAKFILIDCQVL